MLQTPWIRRLVALLLLAVVIATIVNLGILPLYQSHQELDAAIAEARHTLGKYNELAAGKAPGPDFDEADFSGIYHTGQSEGLAAADLQGRINAILSDGEGEVASLQQLPIKVDHAGRRLTIRAQLVATNQSLVTILRSIQTQSPWLFLDNLNIQSRATPNPEDERSADPSLSISMDLYAYLKEVSP